MPRKQFFLLMPLLVMSAVGWSGCARKSSPTGLSEAEAELQVAQTIAQIRLLADRGDWDALPVAVAAANGMLLDAQHQVVLRQVMTLTRAAERYDTADAICKHLLFALPPDKTGVRSLAAHYWIENAMATNRVEIPNRLMAMLDANMPPSEVALLFQRYYYRLIDQPAVLQAMCDLGERLLPSLVEKESLESIKMMVLDGAFIREDYDAAIRLLEVGIPDRDEAWHKMTLAKVKAHRALKNNQLREAVGFFRDFMARVRTLKDEDTIDPSTGIQHSREMIIGRNARRIGEILAAIPDPQAASKAFDEARAHYRAALAMANAETRPIIEAELALLP